VGRGFVKELTAISVKETHEEGDFLFRTEDPANCAYLLLIGRVNLKTGETGQVVHIVNRPGESFGWSNFVVRDAYSTTAECKIPTKL